ncbi:MULTISPECIES: hypothetical protein [Pseudomonas]|uniref:Uncharacterized protein n=4 Tax=Pseudomonas TaxID=286 RepID=A0A3G1DGH7_PSEAI|nr:MULTISPECIES: hypothetical protein [Pseudomonas]AXQ51154.1 hypothetical protein DZC31_31260 [Stenotrophomonas rhizophila]AMP35818.1 Hypothetical protein [Pseudomonas aeruginosa]ESW38608.1 hypothetical protein O164_17175 [Pseudomonas taiwanensis SJ9]MCE0755535.1 hypothetical protein [Pseudomonas asiatica]MCE0853354.1 hypothetical protein [Pseudomonas asiatica]
MFDIHAGDGNPEVPADLSSRNLFFESADTGLSSVAWAQLMDRFREEQGWADTRLSKEIGISISMIRQCRVNMRPLPPPARIRTLGAMGVEVTLSTLLAALPEPIREAVEAANQQSQVVRETLLYGFFDRLDAGGSPDLVSAFFDGLAEISGLSETEQASRIGLSLEDFTSIRKGRKPIPFRVKMAISGSYTANELGPLILSLLPAA